MTPVRHYTPLPSEIAAAEALGLSLEDVLSIAETSTTRAEFEASVRVMADYLTFVTERVERDAARRVLPSQEVYR